MDLRKFLSILLAANLIFILMASLVQMMGMLLSVIRWRTILRNFDIHSEFLPLTKITFIGYFFNLFLPSGIGGDFFRAYYLAKREKREISSTLTTTFLERSAGLCALLVIGTFFAAFQDIRVEGFRLFYVFLIVISLYLLANVALFHSWMHRKISSFLARKNLQQMQAKMELIYQGLNTLRGNKRSIVTALGISLVVQFLSVVIVWIAAQAIEIEAPFRIFLIFVPLINLSIMVPLTINGIGLRESLFYLLFSQIGFPVEMAVSLSLVTFSLYLLTALPGLIIYSLYKKEEHLDEIVVEAEGR
ncbi:flippase-like domain-containing protein [Acidobacteria bacterium AH-259-D05]|nr:flippase-like domain-containing protein [Acidobacteria bacterium AH-259-D05]